MHTVGALHPWTPNDGFRTVQVFTEKHPCVSEPAHCKPVLLKGQLHVCRCGCVCDVCMCICIYHLPFSTEKAKNEDTPGAISTQSTQILVSDDHLYQRYKHLDGHQQKLLSCDCPYTDYLRCGLATHQKRFLAKTTRSKQSLQSVAKLMYHGGWRQEHKRLDPKHSAHGVVT